MGTPNSVRIVFEVFFHVLCKCVLYYSELICCFFLYSSFISCFILIVCAFVFVIRAAWLLEYVFLVIVTYFGVKF
jgi:hypothetical protein